MKIKRKFSEAWSYVKETRNYIYLIIAIFIMSSLIGFFYSEQFGFIDEFLREILEKTQGLNALELMLFIFQNNLMSAFLASLLGVFLGIFPIVNAISNGVVLGYVLSISYEVSGILEFWRILPHGIFELTAIFIALGVGVKLGMFVFAPNKRKELRRRFYNSANVFLMIVIPLLILAAVIEGLLIALVG